MENKEFEQFKRDIMKELQGTVSVKPSKGYSWSRELNKLIDRYDKLLADYKLNVENIKKRYSKEVAEGKIHELDLNLIGERAEIKSLIDCIPKNESNRIESLLKVDKGNKEYKENRRDIVNLLLGIGKSLDEDTTRELLEDIISANDLTTLKALKYTSSPKASVVYTSAIERIEKDTRIDNLLLAIREAKKYIENPKEGKSIMLGSLLNQNK
ncbi:hypothetical protein V3G48_23995 [Escherichia coli]|uniref:hypothetical protein n=1 Tax=Escherichia coli TaxID=562 RepID=UPI002F26C72B